MWSIPQSLSNSIKKNWLKWFVVACYCVAYFISRKSGISCIWKSLTGIPCPGCGFTRAIGAALRLDFAGAWQYHPLFALFPVLLLLFFRDGRIFRNDSFNTIAIVAIAVLFAAVWCIRLITGSLPA